MKSDWSKFIEQVIQDADPFSPQFIEIGRDKDGKPSSIAYLPNKACSGRLALWAAKIREIKNNLLAWLRGITRRR